MIFDITPPISASFAVWPGDTPPSREMLCDMRQGAGVTLSALRATVHLGAHADAPSHYAADAQSIEQRDLDLYLGPCQVIRVVSEPKKLLGVADLHCEIRAARVLLATGTFPDPTSFNKDFASLSVEFIDYMHGRGVRLIGIDTPSVDPFESKDLPAHRRFLRYDMAILEGLLLRDVPEGEYELIALPLRLVGFDASPVRAILRRL